jgi:hypothetical protein
LVVSHASTAAQFRDRKVVAEVAPGADQVVEFEGPVLPSREGSEPIEDEFFTWSQEAGAGTEAFVKEQAMPAESFCETLDRGVADAEPACDLAVAGAADLEAKYGFEEIWALQPVGDGEGLRTEGPMTAGASVTLDAMGRPRAVEEPGPLEAPTLWIQMEIAARVGAEEGW